MNKSMSEEQFAELQEILLPILSDAAVGRFHRDVPLQKERTHDFNMVLMGVQILLEVIREQQAELQQSEARLVDVQRRTSEILARVLDRTLPG